DAERHREQRQAAARSGLSAAVWLAAGSLALFSMALGISAVALPVTLIQDLGGGTGAVGLSYSLCAFLEVPVMMGIALRPGAFVSYRGMALGFVAFVAHFVVLALATSVGGVMISQVPRALGIGLISCVGISYLQNLMPGRAGAAAALYANTGQVGALLAGLSAGLWAAHLGFHSLFWACVALAVGGLVLLDLGRRCRQPG
ncbi:hypothetical protein P7D22_22195, partial [Lichenihabitans sp. Uapishka_5]|nr:hypothetical protein [Lichenihabitans sp. Uapishka_5]